MQERSSRGNIPDKFKGWFLQGRMKQKEDPKKAERVLQRGLSKRYTLKIG